MQDNSYRKAVIGSLVTLPVSFKNARNGDILDLTGRDVTVRIAPYSGALVVTDADCTIDGEVAYYEWDTTGRNAGKYLVQFTLDGEMIEPASPLTIYLEPRLGS